VITDWPISDHMIGTSHRGPVRRSSLLRVNSVNDHSGHMVQGYSQQPCTL
ncbi:unnamed protein product, partial [Staurois parvus]